MLKTLPALAALAIASALVIPTVSQAAERTEARVSYADLNLTTDTGQDRVQRQRILHILQVGKLVDFPVRIAGDIDQRSLPIRCRR